MSRDHSLALASCSTATCSSLKTYILTTRDDSQLSEFCLSYILRRLCVCVCMSVSVSTPLAVRDILCLSLRLLSASSATKG